MNRRRFLQAGSLFGTFGVGSAFNSFAAGNSGYPNHAIQLIIPFAPGGPTDILGRFVAKTISDKFGQSVVTINRPGAGGNIATQDVARAAPDGYTLLLATGAHVIRPSIYPNLKYDAIADFSPICLLASGPFVLTVRPGLPANSVQDLIALARREPGKLNFASGGTGTASHLAGESFKQATGIDMTHVPYNGAALSSEALLSGVVDMLFNNMLSALPMIKANQVRALGVTSLQRSPMLPEVPTIAESGVPGFDIETWYALLAPAHMDPGTQSTLNTLLTGALAAPYGQTLLASQGFVGSVMKPGQVREFLVSEENKWSQIVKRSGAKLE